MVHVVVGLLFSEFFVFLQLEVYLVKFFIQDVLIFHEVIELSEQ